MKTTSQILTFFFSLSTHKDISALTIQRAWLSHMDKTVFQLLKHTICAVVCILLFVFFPTDLITYQAKRFAK